MYMDMYRDSHLFSMLQRAHLHPTVDSSSAVDVVVGVDGTCYRVILHRQGASLLWLPVVARLFS